MELNEIFKVMEIVELLQRDKFFITLDDMLLDEEKDNLTNLLEENLSVKINFEGGVECKIFNNNFHDYLFIEVDRDGDSREVVHKLDLGRHLLHNVSELKALKTFLISEKYNKEIIDKLTDVIKLLEEKE